MSRNSCDGVVAGKLAIRIAVRAGVGMLAGAALLTVPNTVPAQDDPAAALDAMRAIPDAEMREDLLAAALSAWSVQDAVAMFAYIASVEDWDLSRPGVQGPGNMRLSYTLLNDTDFRALVALVDDLPPPFDASLRRSVIPGLARQDPIAATELFETLPAREQRAAGFRIATEYAGSDPLAAFEWARATGEPRFVDNVLHAVGERDPLLALDLASQTEEPAHWEAVAQAAIQGGAIAPEAFGAALLALPESSRREQAIETMTHYWAVRDPDRDPVHVLEWLIAQGEATAASPQLFRRVAGRLAYSDPDLAASDVDRIPQAARSVWIQSIAGGFAARDPALAAEWIEQYRGEPAYAPSVADIAFSMASRDGPGAADLLRRASLDNDPSAISRVARVWAGRGDPRAVIGWLQTLADDDARVSGLGGAARVWTGRSPDEAEQWVLNLRMGEERDTILYSMISRAFISNTDPGDTLFLAYSNDYARQLAAANAARSLAEGENEAAARRLLDRYVTDPELRRQYDNGEALPAPN